MGIKPAETFQKTYSPTRNEIVHMKPTNNFEDITEQEFDHRERAKAEYRLELQEQMNDAREKKDEQKKKEILEDVEAEQKIYK